MSSLTSVDKADLAGQWRRVRLYHRKSKHIHQDGGSSCVAFEIRAKDLPQGKFPNSTFEGSLRPAGEDPAGTSDQITDKSSGGRVSPEAPSGEHYVAGEPNGQANERKTERKKTKNIYIKKKRQLLPCPRLHRDLPQPQHRPDQAAVPDEPGRDSS